MEAAVGFHLRITSWFCTTVKWCLAYVNVYWRSRMLELRCSLCPTSQRFHKDARKIASWEAAWPLQSGHLATFSGAPFMLLGGLGLLHPFQAGASQGAESRGPHSGQLSAHFPGREEGRGSECSLPHSSRSPCRADGERPESVWGHSCSALTPGPPTSLPDKARRGHRDCARTQGASSSCREPGSQATPAVSMALAGAQPPGSDGGGGQTDGRVL